LWNAEAKNELDVRLHVNVYVLVGALRWLQTNHNDNFVAYVFFFHFYRPDRPLRPCQAADRLYAFVLGLTCIKAVLFGPAVWNERRVIAVRFVVEEEEEGLEERPRYLGMSVQSR
jgi:hypothetical protein